MKISIDGFENLQKNLGKLQKKVESLDGNHQVPITELFPLDFMKRYTEFQSIEEMMSEGGIDLKSEKEIKLETNEAWNIFVSKHADFSSWASMLKEATAQWTSKKLGL